MELQAIHSPPDLPERILGFRARLEANPCQCRFCRGILDSVLDFEEVEPGQSQKILCVWLDNLLRWVLNAQRPEHEKIRVTLLNLLETIPRGLHRRRPWPPYRQD